jgi:integrase
VQLYARIGAKFGRKRLGEITRKEAVEFHLGLRRGGLSPASADLHAALLRRLLNLAVEWEHVDRNVLAKFPLFREPNQRDHYLTPEQLARLVEVLRTDHRRGVCQVAMFLLSTGARLNEALSAKWRDIDLPGRRWTILAETAKSKRTRSVPLNDSALMVLEEVGTRGKFEDVFVNPRTGKAYTAVFRVWSRIRIKAALPKLRLHDLRHEFASQLVCAGQSLYVVSQLLGHASPLITQRYAHLSTKALQEAAGAASVIVRQPAAPARPEAANAPTAADGAEAPQRQPGAGPRAA